MGKINELQQSLKCRTYACKDLIEYTVMGRQRQSASNLMKSKNLQKHTIVVENSCVKCIQNGLHKVSELICIAFL